MLYVTAMTSMTTTTTAHSCERGGGVYKIRSRCFVHASAVIEMHRSFTRDALVVFIYRMCTQIHAHTRVVHCSFGSHVGRPPVRVASHPYTSERSEVRPPRRRHTTNACARRARCPFIANVRGRSLADGHHQHIIVIDAVIGACCFQCCEHALSSVLHYSALFVAGVGLHFDGGAAWSIYIQHTRMYAHTHDTAQVFLRCKV